MKILFAASEAAPFCKTGGLADVAGALPLALKAKKHDVRLVLPRYRGIDPKAFGLSPTGVTLRIPLGDDVETASVWEGKLAGKVPAYFIEAPKFFDRDGVYLGADGKDYPDNDDRFILFSRAVLETAKALDFRPDIVHAHDWQTGLIPAYLDTIYQLDAFFLPTASVFTIHNIAYQGIFPKNTVFEAGFSWTDFTPARLEFFEKLSFLKAGLVFAHGLNTVSPGYAAELTSGPAFGRGMEGVLRARGADFVGILNGLDMKVWDPAKDTHLARKFSAKTLDARAENKAVLQKAVGLVQDPAAPLLAMVSRLDPQKGIDVAMETVEPLLDDGVQAVFLGSGNLAYETALSALARKYPGRAAFSTDFNEPRAHQIYGGADIFLMPSRFEPCGLSQLISLRYGCVPVVTPTGGLKDTVEPLDEKTGRGDGFVAEGLEDLSFREALTRALALFRRDPAAWRGLMARGMTRDFGWSRSVDDYLALYRRALEKKGVPPR